MVAGSVSQTIVTMITTVEGILNSMMFTGPECSVSSALKYFSKGYGICYGILITCSESTLLSVYTGYQAGPLRETF